MSSICILPEKKVVWTDTNNIGLYQEWVNELVASGYTLEDRRTTKDE